MNDPSTIRQICGQVLIPLPILLFLTGAGAFQCDDREVKRKSLDDSRIIARVNESVLREDELNDDLPGFFGNVYKDGGKKEYVEQWVESELLYQKALQDGLQWDEEIQKKVVQFQHMMLEQEVLRKYLVREIDVTAEEIAQYYDENGGMFQRDDGEFRVARLIFQNEDDAKEVAGALEAAPERFDEIIEIENNKGRIQVQDLGFYPKVDLEEAFGNQVEELSVGRISSQLLTSAGNFYLMRIMETREKGSVRDLSEVEDRIRGILLHKKSENARRMWLDELKRAADIEIATDLSR